MKFDPKTHPKHVYETLKREILKHVYLNRANRLAFKNIHGPDNYEDMHGRARLYARIALAHRRWFDRRETRYLQLAYAFWRGVPYRKVEPKAESLPNAAQLMKALFYVGFHRDWLDKKNTGLLTADGRIVESLASIQAWINEPAKQQQAA